MTTQDIGVEPGRRERAPESLGLVQAFVNTNDLEEGRDELDTPQGLERWLVDHGLIGPDSFVRQWDHARALAVREAIRALAAANNGEPLDPEAPETLNRVAGAGGLRVRFTAESEAQLEPLSPGVGGALARIVADVYRSMVEGSWPRLKACRRHRCRWVFYDRSRNRSGTWCAMAVCGNRTKASAYRQRQRARA